MWPWENTFSVFSTLNSQMLKNLDEKLETRVYIVEYEIEASAFKIPTLFLPALLALSKCVTLTAVDVDVLDPHVPVVDA
jgi:hypothetical protein